MTSNLIDINNKLARINGLTENLLIPESTRSLLWITAESNPNSGIIGFDPLSGEAIYNEGLISADSIDDVQAEPSLIWTRLPVEPNSLKLPSEPFYYPTYRGLSPQQRFQYLNWLRDISQPTWLSYVFLYLYGLERHLVLGDYNAAVKEIKLLLEHHDIGGYAYHDLALASVVRGKNILESIPEIEEYLYDPARIRAYYRMPLTPTVVLRYASQAGFTNTRYIKGQTVLFREKLQQAIDRLESSMGGPFFSKFSFRAYTKGHLINVSLNSYTASVQIPSTQQDDEFEKVVYSLLDKAHSAVRLELHPNSVIRKTERQVMNSARKRELNKELDDVIDMLELQYRKSDRIAEDLSDVLPITKSLRQLDDIRLLSRLEPEKALMMADDLIGSGYRAPAAHSALAGAYMSKNDYQTALDTLMQARVDYGYGYDFQWELRSIVDRFRSELKRSNKKPRSRQNLTEKTKKSTEGVDAIIRRLTNNYEQSSPLVRDRSSKMPNDQLDKSRHQLDEIMQLYRTNSGQAVKLSLALMETGYRVSDVYKALASAYVHDNEPRLAFDTLMQARADHGYDFTNELQDLIINFKSTIDPPKQIAKNTDELDRVIKQLMSDRVNSAWSGVDKTLELTLGGRNKLDKKVLAIRRTSKVDPARAIAQAYELFDSGYRTEFICRTIAGCYRQQEQYRDEIDFLLQIKCDFPLYDFDSTLRQAIRLLEKSEGSLV